MKTTEADCVAELMKLYQKLVKTEKAIKKDSNPSNFEIHIYPKIPKLEQQQNKKIN